MNAKNESSKKRPRRSAREVLGAVLFFSLAMSLVYSAVRFSLAPDTVTTANEYVHVKGDYALIFLQCLLGVFVLGLPSLFSRRWNLTLPNFMYVMYYVFLYCAVFLGEVLQFYYRIPHWDNILHFFSGAMLGALGFILVEWLNEDEHIRVSLSPAFVAIFAFCFALACGAVWEIYEFFVDHLLGLNMQKFATASGELLLGHEALIDTMEDLIVDSLAAFLISCLGYFRLKSAAKNLPIA